MFISGWRTCWRARGNRDSVAAGTARAGYEDQELLAGISSTEVKPRLNKVGVNDHERNCIDLVSGVTHFDGEDPSYRSVDARSTGNELRKQEAAASNDYILWYSAIAATGGYRINYRSARASVDTTCSCSGKRTKDIVVSRSKGSRERDRPESATFREGESGTGSAWLAVRLWPLPNGCLLG